MMYDSFVIQSSGVGVESHFIWFFLRRENKDMTKFVFDFNLDSISCQ